MDGEHFDSTTGEVIALPPGMPPAIAQAIIAVKKQVKQLGADDRNEHGKYSFVSVDKFYAIIGKLMAEAGLALLIDETTAEVKTSDKSGNPWLFCQYDLVFMHESGAMSRSLRRSCALPIAGPQAYGAAQSYIEKQFLRQVFKVPTGDKDADDTAQGEGAPNRSAAAVRGGDLAREAARAPSGRQQAAPGKTEGQLDADKRWKEIRDSIDASPDASDLAKIEESLAWQALDRVIRAAEPPATADHAMGLLRDRIARRHERLAETEDAYR